MNPPKQKILFVCMGNICRSPTAQGIFENKVNHDGLSDQFNIDSSGTHSYHTGNLPDSRSSATALKNGIDLSSQRSRQIEQQDFEIFDYIVAMDRSNYAELCALAPENHRIKVVMMMSYATQYSNNEVPDPYYGDDGFEIVFQMLDDACQGLLNELRA
ncbi:MAG: protein-tyrosine phosphatase [Gammaproteobacteria bacterium]|jgi:protein-tyrosine phosphatase